MKSIVIVGIFMLFTPMPLIVYKAALDADVLRCEESRHALNVLQIADADMDGDTIKAGVGLASGADGPASRRVVSSDANARKALVDLRQYAGKDDEWVRLIDGLARDYEAKHVALQALRQQSAQLSVLMSNFSAESRKQVMEVDGLDAARAIGALAGAVYRLGQDGSPAVLQDVSVGIEAMAHAGASDVLVGYARDLARSLPQVRSDALQLQPLSQMPSFASVKSSLDQRQSALRSRWNHVRSGLQVLAITMLLSLLYLVKLLHDRAHILRRRSDFDRLMMAMSRDLISPERSKTDALIVSYLDHLSKWLCDIPAGFALVFPDAATHKWAASNGGEFDAVVERLVAGMPARSGRGRDLVVMREDHSVVELVLGDYVTLRQARWVCLRRHAEPGMSALLCFRYVHAGPLHDYFGDLILLNSALDTLAEGLERQRLEDEAQGLMQRLHRARHMEAVGTMACGISHNFNNIIGVIRGSVDTASLGLTQQSPVQTHLTQITRALDHAKDLVEAILSFGRAQNYSMQLVELNALIAQTAPLLEASLPDSVVLNVQQHEQPLHAWGNPVQLQQVVLNLVTNAAQAMSMSGTVSIRLSQMMPTDQASALARLEVDDHGVGIPAQRLGRIFDPFFTTREGGTGLGLATVKQIVTNHDGRIDVVSQPGLGTTFTVDLPLCDQVGSVATGPHHETWLVLCDDPDGLERLEDLLAALGHEPVGYADTASAKDAIAMKPDRFDGVLIQLKDNNEAAASAHALHGSPPSRTAILALHVENLWTASRVGCAFSEVIAAPVDVSELAQAMERSRNGRRSARATLHM